MQGPSFDPSAAHYAPVPVATRGPQEKVGAERKKLLELKAMEAVREAATLAWAWLWQRLTPPADSVLVACGHTES